MVLRHVNDPRRDYSLLPHAMFLLPSKYVVSTPSALVFMTIDAVGRESDEPMTNAILAKRSGLTENAVQKAIDELTTVGWLVLDEDGNHYTADPTGGRG